MPRGQVASIVAYYHTFVKPCFVAALSSTPRRDSISDLEGMSSWRDFFRCIFFFTAKFDLSTNTSTRIARSVTILLVFPSRISEYGPVFRLSTVINNSTALSDYLTGDNILSCFGFDSDRFGTDLEYLVIIGIVGLLLAYVLLKRA